jgi:hypothetical protein
MNYIPLISSCAVKAAGVLTYVVQCGCITHCALEYIGHFIMVIVFLFSVYYLGIQECPLQSKSK